MTKAGMQAPLDVAAPQQARRAARAREAPDHTGTPAFEVRSSMRRPRLAAEAQADRVADEVLRGPAGRLQATPAIAHLAAPARAADQSLSRGAIGGAGQALKPEVRADMEARFRFDFSRVRVHTDGEADRAAAGLGALAFTFGDDIAFRAGQYAPATGEGRRLLAHELTHVIEQRGAPPSVACQDAPNPGVRFKFALQIDGPLELPQLVLEFIKQYRHLATIDEAIAVRDKEGWSWSGNPPVIGPDELKQHYVLINVTDRTITPSSKADQDARNRYFGKLPKADRDAINAETDREFWERSQYKKGQKLGSSADDKELAKYWMLLRDQLLQNRQAIEALPPEIKSFLFSETATTTIKPEDYAAVVRIAQKLSGMTAAELAEYKSRTTASTTDLRVFEAAIDRYRAERQQRAEVTEERGKVTTKLAALEDVYRQYRAYKSSLGSTNVLAAGGTPMGVGTALGSLPTQGKQREELADKLARHGFKSIEDFEGWIRRYEAAFQKESLALATVMLDQYEHTLVEQENRYKGPAAAPALHKSLAPARKAYADADQVHQDYLAAGGSAVVMSADEMALAAEYTGKRNEALARGDAAVRAVAGTDPLVTNRDFDREALARTPEGGVSAFMLEYIRARRKDITDTRSNIAGSPDMVFVLKEVRAAAYRAQGIKPDSIFDMIVVDHISDLNWQKAIPPAVLAVVALAAGLVSGGTGTVAVLGAATAFGISAYQALETYHNYEVNHAAYGAKLISDDPSFAWVVVAVVAAGLDLAVVGSTIKQFGPAIELFNASNKTAGDVASLAEKLAAAEERVRVAVIRAAQAEREAAEAWAAARASANAVLPGLSGMALSLAAKYAYPIFLSIRRFGRDFQRLLASSDFIKVVGDASKLKPEELAQLKVFFEQVVEEWGQIAKHAEKLGMTESEAAAFMKMHIESPTTTVENVMASMDAWKLAKGEAQQAVESGGKLGKPFGFADAEQFARFREAAGAAMKKAMKKIDPKAEAYLQGSSVSGVSFKRAVPFDAASDFDIAITSRDLMKKAEKLGLELKLSPRRIGPLQLPKDEAALRELGLFDVRRKLVDALEAEGGTAREINFMLFDNVDAATKPIGAGLGGETARPAIPLKGD